MTDVLAADFELSGRRNGDSGLASLRAKYQELARKYAAVVKLLERNTSQQAIVFRLGLWALDVTASALALVRDGEISMQNARWLQLDEAAGGWRLEDGDGLTFYPTFRDLAAGEARRLPKRPPATAVRRFRRGDGAQFLEVRLERPESDPRVVLVIAHDATDQVQARRELSETREALLKNEQLAMVGELASSVAHDLGNTLRGISARISVLATDEAIAQTKAEVIAGLRESVEAAIATIRDLHDVARMGRLDPGPVQLGSVIQRAAEILRLRQPHDAPRIEVNTAVARLPPVLGTVSELSHLFLSLFFNAREAMSKGGTINVVGTRSRDQVRVSVFDSGAGFSPEAQAHLFEPFFTTKGPGGTGLGLWLAQSTMRRFHGTIAVRNRRRGGAEIQLEFQIAGKRDARVTQGRARGRPREPGAPSS